jgi:hypothetical protein
VPLDLRRGLEPVHARHDDIEQDDREVVREQRLHRLHRLLPGPDGHQDLVQRSQDRVQRDQVLPPVVNQKDSGLP